MGSIMPKSITSDRHHVTFKGIQPDQAVDNHFADVRKMVDLGFLCLSTTCN
ncbi:MAG: hypothetical protein RIR18_1979 [Pseudomonadota bacterium]|jgi:hypothetical protein